MDDAISRSAVLEEARSLESLESLSHYANVYVVDVDDIKALPALDVVPVVHGHWIKVLGGNGLVSTIRCSECDNFDNPSYIQGNYCWFCGAKMDGEENEAD